MSSLALPFLQALKQQQAPPPDPGQVPLTPDQQSMVTQLQTPPNPLQAITQGSPQNPTLAPETKGHKLLKILMGGAEGGLVGAGQPTVGQGFQTAEQLPFIRAMRQQQLQQGQAQTELLKQQAQQINVPGIGMMPAGLAKVLFPQLLKGQTAVAVQGMKGQTAENVANINKRFVPVQGVGLFDTQSRQIMPGSENGIVITPEIAKDHDLPDQFIGKPMTLQQLAAVQRSDVFQNSPMMTAQGPIVVNRKTSTAKPVTGPAGQTYSPPALASPREVADQNNPGQTKIVSGGQAIAEGAAGPTSASVQVPKKAAASEVPSNIGNQKLAFNTAIAHADLLRQAVKALGNGDQQTLSGLKNRFKNEFGVAGPITAQAIADAYQREVTSVLSKGHMTDSEIASVGKTLDPNKQNYAQIDSVIGAYQSLAQSKMQQLDRQKTAAVQQSQPKNSKTSQQSVADPLGLR